MNDRTDVPSSDDQSPEIAEVRRLLADARHVDPMPDDVAARMNAVIARLGDETPAARPEPPDTNVIPIAPHRRRRAAALLVAAAAIVVGGVAFQNAHLSPHGGGSAAESQADAQSGQPVERGGQQLEGAAHALLVGRRVAVDQGEDPPPSLHARRSSGSTEPRQVVQPRRSVRRDRRRLHQRPAARARPSCDVPACPGRLGLPASSGGLTGGRAVPLRLVDADPEHHPLGALTAASAPRSERHRGAS